MRLWIVILVLWMLVVGYFGSRSRINDGILSAARGAAESMIWWGVIFVIGMVVVQIIRVVTNNLEESTRVDEQKQIKRAVLELQREEFEKQGHLVEVKRTETALFNLIMRWCKKIFHLGLQT